MTDWNAYREAPKKVLGMSLAEAESFLQRYGFTYGIASVDGDSRILPAMVMTHLYVTQGIVVKTVLDGAEYRLET